MGAGDKGSGEHVDTGSGEYVGGVIEGEAAVEPSKRLTCTTFLGLPLVLRVDVTLGSWDADLSASSIQTSHSGLTHRG